MQRSIASQAVSQELIAQVPATPVMEMSEQALFAEAAVEFVSAEQASRSLQDAQPIDTSDPVGQIQSGSYLPTLEPMMGTVAFLLNIVFPGSGSWMAAVLDPNGFNMFLFFVGFLQFALTSIVIGWLWSIYDGYRLWKKAN
jgi:hypothetical protein